MKKILSTILALAACTTLTAQDFKITHGPWLCDLTSDGVTVVVNYGKEAYAGELGTVGPEDFAVFQRGEGAA